MEWFSREFSRRRFLEGVASGVLALPLVKAFTEEQLRYFEEGSYAEDLVRTPPQTEGPFYPDKLPLDKDNDLLVIGKGRQAQGEITHLTGRVLDTRGEPLKGALVEIWQVDHHGVYLHSGSDNASSRDKAFQGYGKFETDSSGAYRFRTIKPVPYPGRTPHIHVKVSKGGRELLTTQCYVKGHPQNDRDGLLNAVRDAKARASLIVPFEKVKDSKLGELAATFQIVVGFTPEC